MSRWMGIKYQIPVKERDGMDGWNAPASQDHKIWDFERKCLSGARASGQADVIFADCLY